MSWTGSPRYTQRKGHSSYSHEPEEYPAKRSRNSTAAEEAWGLTPRHRPSIFQQRARRSSAAGSARLNVPNRRLTRQVSPPLATQPDSQPAVVWEGTRSLGAGLKLAKAPLGATTHWVYTVWWMCWLSVWRLQRRVFSRIDTSCAACLT